MNPAYGTANNYQLPARIINDGSAYQQSAHYALNSTTGQSSPVGAAILILTITR